MTLTPDAIYLSAGDYIKGKGRVHYKEFYESG